MPEPHTPEQELLFSAIRQHLADLDTRYGFARRLAKENRWDDFFSRDLIGEYARFLFIAREGGHPVSPPALVDKVWHLHLIHTEAYWDDLCPNILKMKLQHAPRSGNPGEDALFAEWARQTLVSYWRFFGIPSPAWEQADRFRPSLVAAYITLGVAAGLAAAGFLAALWGFLVLAIFGLVLAAFLWTQTWAPFAPRRRKFVEPVADPGLTGR